MYTNTSQPLPGHHFKPQLDKTRIKTSPSTVQLQPKPSKNGDETIISFMFSEYPFLNNPHSPVTALKTIVNFKLTSETLQQLVSVNHPNIISIRKIVKTNPRESGQLKPGQISYTFFYEPVLYSLQYLTEHPNEHPRLYNLLLSFDLKNILLSVHNYLQNSAISHGFRIQDIGITAQGNLKLYLAPNAVVQSKPLVMTQKALQFIVQWWSNYMNSLQHTPFKKEKKTLQPPKLSNDIDISLEDGSLDQNELEKELGCLLDDEPTPKKCPFNDMKSSTQSLSRVGSIQMEKMKKIDQQVKNFRAKLNQQQTINRRIDQQKLKKMQHSLPFQPKADQYYPQPIQQNINCINIYNHNNAPLPRPHRFPTMPPNYYNHYAYSPFYQQQVYDQQDNYSQDTYDIQFQTQFEPVQNEGKDKDQFRHTIFTPSQRDLSEHPKRKSKTKKNVNNEEIDFRQNSNQVYKNKNYTESAGPLQFKSFVSKYMKPKIQQQQQQTKPEPSLTNNAQSLRSFSINSKQQKIEVSQMHRNHSQNEFQPMIPLKTRYKTEIEGKVKQALEKTKNAIALLHKVKKNKKQGRHM